MAWQDRIKPAAYTSPSGARMMFQYEDVSRAVDKKTAAFNFPDADGTYVQDLGHQGRRYPMRMFFSGNDYDTEAAAFEDLLLETGVGSLEHPVYGAVDVVPYGSITRRDDLVTAANQAVIETEFYETIGVIYPVAQVDRESQVRSAVSAFNGALAAEYSNNVAAISGVDRVGLKAVYQALLNNAEAILSPIAATEKMIEATFKDIVDSIKAGIDILVADPLTLAFQTAIMIQTPARAAALIRDRLEAYGTLADTTGTAVAANEFYTTDLFTSGAISGAVSSSVETRFASKPEAIAAADQIITDFDRVVAWRDAEYSALGATDTGEAYQALQEAVALCAGYLIEISFTLAQERRIVLDRDRSIIDVCAEVYGAVDEKLDYFIQTNELTGSEIIELSKGQSIVYYV